jgi:signal peptidase
MEALRRIALGVLWLLAAVGAGCAVIWGATAAGLIQPLVVISGSMEPEIMTGDLLIATKVAAGELEVGDVAALPSDLTHNLVTHRIEKITADGDGTYTVSMKGDNNAFSDALDYSVSGDAWVPQWQIPGAGTIVTRLTTPPVAIPLLTGLVALLGIAWLIPAPERAPKARNGAPATSVATQLVGVPVDDPNTTGTSMTRRGHRDDAFAGAV